MDIDENITQHFWALSDRNKKTDDECWEWLGMKDKDGYGRFKIHYKPYRANRVAYTINNGEIEPGMWILHSCDNPSCVNPKHLRQGTNIENSQDAVDRNRMAHQIGELHGGRKVSEEDVIEIRRLYSDSSIALSVIAEKYNIKISTVNIIATGKTWKHIGNICPRRLHKLGKENAEEIRVLYATKEYTRKELAEKYGTTVTSITNIINNKMWAI
jgi:hypothetical protein